MSKILDIINLKLIRYSCPFIFSIPFGVLCLMAYFKNEYYFSILLLLFWFIMLLIWSSFVSSIICFSYGLLFFSVYYLKLRFSQLTFSGKIHSLEALIESHNRLTLMTNEYNLFFRILMAINHYIYSVTAVLLYYTFFYSEGIFLYRLANLFVAIFGTFLIYLVTKSSASLSAEAHRLYKSMNSNYLLHTLSIKMKLKVSFENSFFNS